MGEAKQGIAHRRREAIWVIFEHLWEPSRDRFRIHPELSTDIKVSLMPLLDGRGVGVVTAEKGDPPVALSDKMLKRLAGRGVVVARHEIPLNPDRATVDEDDGHTRTALVSLDQLIVRRVIRSVAEWVGEDPADGGADFFESIQSRGRITGCVDQENMELIRDSGLNSAQELALREVGGVVEDNGDQRRFAGVLRGDKTPPSSLANDEPRSAEFLQSPVRGLPRDAKPLRDQLFRGEALSFLHASVSDLRDQRIDDVLPNSHGRIIRNISVLCR